MVPHGDSASAPPKSLETLRKYDPPEMGKPVAARKTEKWWVLITTILCVNGSLAHFYALIMHYLCTCTYTFVCCQPYIAICIYVHQ